jgi:hypothetical protein
MSKRYVIRDAIGKRIATNGATRRHPEAPRPAPRRESSKRDAIHAELRREGLR